MLNKKPSAAATRRKFLAGAAVASAAVAAPTVLKAQGPITMRWQSTWATKDIFHEYALDYAKKVNDMAGGDLKIDVLPAGAVVKAFDLVDAVSKGTLDGGHGVLVYWYGKNPALALWGSGPAFGMDTHMLLAWHKYGGGKELLADIYKAINLNVQSYAYGPMPTEPLGWYKKPITSVDDFKGLKFRTVGLGIEMFGGMGAAVTALAGPDIVPAMDRGLIDAAEFNNPSSDRALGFPDVSKVYMMQSFHQSAEPFEIMFNKTKFDALPPKLKSILENAVEAASSDMFWKACDRYSQDYIDIQVKDKVKVYKTPDSILQAQLKIWDDMIAKRGNDPDNPWFGKVLASQKAFAERAGKWFFDQSVDYRIAFNHYFGKKT
ncbi:MAG TPA: TRAP transporter substrate-binding protein [Pseudolabrys sp.]|jgi:TRAP-type mannitol/chloroaromatic compound transport system substrate-binding protein|nr:TRAP transporter substrate-binding protein [Pseudolabrys sp.]